MTAPFPIDLERHPCFNAKVKGQYGRVHLPVAPKCNIKCNYCNRKYDCVNESRPGVTSTVLSPHQALEYMEKVLEKEPRITVAGIAGPGDPFANADETLTTMRLIRNRFPDLILCLASNGMNLAPYAEEIAAIGVSHVTVTINAVDPAISAKIYSWVRDGKMVYRGQQGAALLLARQLESVRLLKQHGVTVKVNTIVIPGVNDHHVEAVAAKMQELGVDLLNCMAMFPNADTVFENIPEPDKEAMVAIRQTAEKYLPQMRHCTRCRADAVGLLDNDRTEEFRGCLTACAAKPIRPDQHRPYVAVATMEGVLVNQHLGEAWKLQIWGQEGDDFTMIEERETPQSGGGEQRWLALARILADCRAVLVNGIGETPSQLLEKSGIKPVEMGGFIDRGLTAIYTGQGLNQLKNRRRSCSEGACSGSGGGCG
ncbi:MAG: radical SAM protein [Desulfobulbaceae bacterium]|nr:radical SAM protein [Desulfobulbaceae bacterium]